jgi:hypothetical protein
LHAAVATTTVSPFWSVQLYSRVTGAVGVMVAMTLPEPVVESYRVIVAPEPTVEMVTDWRIPPPAV